MPPLGLPEPPLEPPDLDEPPEDSPPEDSLPEDPLLEDPVLEELEDSPPLEPTELEGVLEPPEALDSAAIAAGSSAKGLWVAPAVCCAEAPVAVSSTALEVVTGVSTRAVVSPALVLAELPAVGVTALEPPPEPPRITNAIAASMATPTRITSGSMRRSRRSSRRALR